MYGRMTTLRRLKDARDDPSRHPIRRMQADRALRKIMAQLRDRKLMGLRERLIRATKYGDQKAVQQIENEILVYEGKLDQVDTHFYTKRDEDEF